MNFLHYYFDWYRGNIWGNIFASVITSAMVVLYTRYLIKLLHRKHTEQHDELVTSLALLHKKIDSQNHGR